MARVPIANLKGPEGKRGPQGLPGAEGVPTDEAVSILLSVPSASQTAADAVVRARQERVVFNVHDFGAVGDGVTDDSAAVQAAVDAAAPLGSIQFESGRDYHLSNLVILNDPITVEGNGATLRKLASSTSRVLFTNHSALGAVGYGAGGRDVTIRNMTVVGDYSAAIESTRDPVITFHHVSGITITNVFFSQGTGHYVDLLGCDTIRIDRCEFAGIRNLPTREFSEAIQMDSSTREGASYIDEEITSYDGLPTRNIRVTSCVFTGAVVDETAYPLPHALGAHAGSLETDDGYYEDIWFTENILRGASDVPTVWFGWVHLPGSRRVTIRGNTFIWDGSPATGSVVAICAAPLPYVIPLAEVTNPTPTKTLINRPPLDWVIDGNIIHGFSGVTGGSRGAIDVRAAGARCRINITGNTVSSAGNGALQVADALDVNVKANTFVNSSSAVGIVLLSMSGAFAENTVTQLGNGHAIRATTCSNLTIMNNVLRGGTTAIRVIGLNNGMVCQNYVYDYTAIGIVVGNGDDTSTSYDVSVIANRLRSTIPTITESIRIGPISTRAMRFGNRYRDGGVITDTGVGTITSAGDAN